MTSLASPQTATFAPSQLDSESEDYDAMPSGTTAVLLLSAAFAIPVLAASLAIIPVVWAAQALTGHSRKG